MDTKERIKVIKRSEQPLTPTKNIKEKPVSAKTTVREMVSTVTEWVNEFQQKSREETQEALRTLFPETSNSTSCTKC